MRIILHNSKFLGKFPISSLLTVVLIGILLQIVTFSVPKEYTTSVDLNLGESYDLFENIKISEGQSLRLKLTLFNISISFHIGIVPSKGSEIVLVHEIIHGNISLHLKAHSSGQIYSYVSFNDGGRFKIMMTKLGISSYDITFLGRLIPIIFILSSIEYYSFKKNNRKMLANEFNKRSNRLWLEFQHNNSKINHVTYQLFIMVFCYFSSPSFSYSPYETSGKSELNHNLFQFIENYGKVAILFLVLSLPILKYQDFWYFGKKESMHDETYPKNLLTGKLAEILVILFKSGMPSLIMFVYHYLEFLSENSLSYDAKIWFIGIFTIGVIQLIIILLYLLIFNFLGSPEISLLFVPILFVILTLFSSKTANPIRLAFNILFSKPFHENEYPEISIYMLIYQWIGICIALGFLYAFIPQGVLRRSNN